MDAKWSYNQVEEVRQRCVELCRECGVEADYASLILDAGDSRVGRADIYYRGDVTFDTLAKIAEAFGTRDSTIYVNNPAVDLLAAARRTS